MTRDARKNGDCISPVSQMANQLIGLGGDARIGPELWTDSALLPSVSQRDLMLHTIFFHSVKPGDFSW